MWKARKPPAERFVALKLLRSDLANEPESRQRLVAVAEVLAGRQLPGVVSVLDTVQDGDQLAIVMDLVNGPNLRQWMAYHGPLAPAEACRLAAKVASGLAAAHAALIVHRDLKPENVVIDEQGDEPIPLITDFGLARLLEESRLTRTSGLVGTPDYVAPEVLTGESASPAADVYALGVMLFEILTGWRPFRGDTVAAVLTQHLYSIPARPEGAPPPLWRLIERALRKVPEQRPSAAEFSRALAAVAPQLEGAPALQRSKSSAPGSAEELHTMMHVREINARANTAARDRSRESRSHFRQTFVGVLIAVLGALVSAGATAFVGGIDSWILITIVGAVLVSASILAVVISRVRDSATADAGVARLSRSELEKTGLAPLMTRLAIQRLTLTELAEMGQRSPGADRTVERYGD